MEQLSRLVRIVLHVSLFMLCTPAAMGELQNVSVSGATYRSVDEVNPHVGVLKGIVVDSSGKSVAGATVAIAEEPKLISDTGPEAGPRRNRVYEVPKGRRLKQGVTKTAVDGTFAFSKLPLSLYTVMAFLPDARFKGQQSLTADNPEQMIHISLEPALHIRGIVVDTEGKPIEGASVSATAEGEALEDPWAFPLSGMTSTAKDGTFEIPAAPVRKYTFLVSRDGTLVGQFQRGITFTGEPLRFVAVKSGQVHGTVIEESTQRPLSDVSLNFLTEMRDINGLPSVNTDDTGHFRVEGLFPGPWKISTNNNPNRQSEWRLAEESVEINVPEGGDVSVLMKMVKQSPDK